MSSEGFKGSFRQSMAWLHTWSGVVFSLLLYFIFVTGTFGYFNAEIDQWMQPELPTVQTSASAEKLLPLGLRYLEREIPDGTRYFVSMPTDRAPGSFRVFANLKEPNEAGESFDQAWLDVRTGEPIVARDTGGGDALYEMHYALHYLPYEVAIYIVGIGTLFMLLAIVTGIVTHKKIFKDFFTLRLGKGQRSWLDSHNISSVLALPFMVMITYSGLLFFTFEYSPGVMLMTMGVDGPARQEMGAHLRPGFQPVEPAGVAADRTSLAAPLAELQRRWGDAPVRFLELSQPGDQNARYRFGGWPDGIERRSAMADFSAVTGEFIQESPRPPADALFSDVMMSLHEGRFSGYPLRWLYFATGLLGCAMVATGSLLWARKRRAQLKGQPAPASLRLMERANLAIIVGLPLGVLAYFWSNRLLPVEFADRAAWEMHILFLTWAASFAHAGSRELRRGWREQVALLAALCLLLPVLNFITTDVHLGNTLTQGDWIRASFDLCVLAVGIVLCLVWRVLLKPEPLPPEDARSARWLPATLAQRFHL